MGGMIVENKHQFVAIEWYLQVVANLFEESTEQFVICGFTLHENRLDQCKTNSAVYRKILQLLTVQRCNNLIVVAEPSACRLAPQLKRAFVHEYDIFWWL